MPVAKIIELSSSSRESFEHAVQLGIERACKTVNNVRGAWIKEQSVSFKDGKIDEFRVDMKITFVLE